MTFVDPMKNLLFLCIFLLCSGCATEPTTTTTTTTSKQTLPGKEPQSLIQENINIGMPRAEAERILGSPTSVTDTATGTTCVWVFGPGSTKAEAPPEPKSKVFSLIGSIAATVAGIFSPIAGVATSIGSQVYSVMSSEDETTSPPVQTESDNTRIVTIEFRDNKVFSIQRARATVVPYSPNQ